MDQGNNSNDPVALLFGDMDKLGPGSDVDTLRVLRALPTRQFRLVVDAGCGTGRQTLVIARELATLVHAVDSHEPFLRFLSRRAREADIPHIELHCMDMKDIPGTFQNIDLLWSEGAAYNIGFEHALTTWAPTIVGGGIAVVSELSWLNPPPDAVRDYFGVAYPSMQSVTDNIDASENAGYKLLTTHTLPQRTWQDGYYEILGPRAKALLDHPDASVRDFAKETLREIEIFEISEGSYGYVFYVLQRDSVDNSHA